MKGKNRMDSLTPGDIIPTNQAEAHAPAHLRERKSALPYGLGIFGSSILAETFGGFAYFYYIDTLGLAMVSAALVRTIFTFWDVLDDPFMGFLSDRTRTRWGRRRPWLFIALPLMGLVFVGVFSVPASFQAPSKLFIYMLVILLVYETLATILWINYSALYPELFKPLLERKRVAIFCQTGNVLGLMVALVLSPLLFQVIGFSKMAMIYAFIAVTLYCISLYFNREGRATNGLSLPTLFLTIRGILADRVFWWYALMMVLFLFSTSMTVFALPFYVKYALRERSEIISFLSGLALLTSLLGMPVWNRLVKTWRIEKVFYITALVSGVGMLGMGLSPTLSIAALFFIMFGGAVQGINVIHIVIRAGLVSRSIERTGNQNEGSYYGLMNSTLRLVGILQSVAMLVAGSLFGYVSGDLPGPHPDLAFRFLIGLLPFFCLCLSALFARTFFQVFLINQSQASTLS